MPSFTHYIITRFMCDNFIKEISDADIHSDEWKEMSFNVAKRHIIPTLENQSCKDFTLIFLVADDINLEDFRRIMTLSDKINIVVCTYSNLKTLIEEVNTDYLITSRLDYDDHVYKDCVKDIQSLLNDKPNVKIFGLGEGISIIDGESDAHLCYNFDWLKDEGCPAPMTSLILNKNAVYKYFDIYKLGFHTEVVKNLMMVQAHYLKDTIYHYSQIYYHHIGKNIDYIWLRHSYSATYILDGTLHNTNIKVDISEKELKDNFGYSIK